MNKMLLFLGCWLAGHSLIAQGSDTLRVYFETDKYLPKDVEQLRATVEQKDLDAARVEVVGYADYMGSDEYNLILSRNRAQAIGVLLRSWVDASTFELSIRGDGELPDASRDPSPGDPGSRRVDIVIHQNSERVTHTPSSESAPEPLVKDGIGVDPQRFVSEETEVLDLDLSEDGDTNVVLEGVGFIPGRHYPLPESRPQLQKLLNTMKKYEDLHIEIQGFICCEYDQFDGLDIDTQTMNLSENRAKFIYDFLIREGIDADRLQYKGYGSSRPKVMPEVSPEDQQANRRVEIKIIRM